jgi:hypothetical protein
MPWLTSPPLNLTEGPRCVSQLATHTQTNKAGKKTERKKRPHKMINHNKLVRRSNSIRQQCEQGKGKAPFNERGEESRRFRIIGRNPRDHNQRHDCNDHIGWRQCLNKSNIEAYGRRNYAPRIIDQKGMKDKPRVGLKDIKKNAAGQKQRLLRFSANRSDSHTVVADQCF